MTGKPTGIRPHALTTLPQEGPGCARGLLPHSLQPELAGSLPSGPRPPTGSLASAAPGQPTWAPLAGLGLRGRSWLSQPRPWLKAPFLLVPSWQYFCPVWTHLFCWFKPLPGKLIRKPTPPCPALANVMRARILPLRSPPGAWGPRPHYVLQPTDTALLTAPCSPRPCSAPRGPPAQPASALPSGI